LPILTGSLLLQFLDEICKRSSRFINSCLRSRYNLVRIVLLCTALYMVNITRLLVEILGIRFGWQLEEFLLGFVLLNGDCSHTCCMNIIPVAQLQLASLVEELSSLREGFVTFDWGNFF